MKTQCPHCNQTFDVDMKYAGEIVGCTSCNQEFVVEPLEITPGVKSGFESKKRASSATLWCSRPAVASYFMGYVTGIFLLIVGIAGMGYSLVLPTRNDFKSCLLFFGIFFIVIAVIILFRAIFTRIFTKYTLTGSKIICKTGILLQKEVSCNLNDVRNVTVVRSVIDQLFDCGSIEISSAATSREAAILLRGIKDYQLVQGLIEKNRKR